MYLLYALTRIRSIARKAGKTTEDLMAHAKANELVLEHEAEQRLAKILLRFPEVIASSVYAPENTAAASFMVLSGYQIEFR